MRTNGTIKKKSIIIGFSIGFVILVALIITLIIVFNFKDESNDDSTQQGVHFHNGDERGTASIQQMPALFLYYFDIEEDNYNYNEEFTIEYQFGINPLYHSNVNYLIEEGDLKISFQAEHFEIISPTEYLYENFIPSDNYVRYDENKNRIYPNKLEIRVKAVTQSESLEEMLFLLKFNLGEDIRLGIEEDIADNGENDRYYSHFGYEEYTKDFQLINSLYYINDELGTLLTDSGTRQYTLLAEECDCEPNSGCNHWLNIRSRTVLLYESLNRRYEKDLITKENYMNELIWYCRRMKVQVYYKDSDEKKFYYVSKKIHAQFLLDEDETKELMELFQEKITQNYIEIAKRFVKILYEENQLTLEEYEAEIQFIEMGILGDYDYIGIQKHFIPFDTKNIVYCREILIERQ